MKRVCAFFLGICILFSLSACRADAPVLDNDKEWCGECGEEISLTDNFCSSCGISLKEETKPTIHIHSYSNATCTEVAQCICGVTSGQALGHNYIEGVCSRCGDKEIGYVKAYSVGETWIVDGQWEFTVNSVTTHRLCNSYSNEEDGYKNEQVVVIDYTYKNLGYRGLYGLEDDLYISSSSFYVYDETGEVAESYACTHGKYPKPCIAGTKSTAQEVFVLPNESSKITLVVKETYYTSNARAREARAQFDLDITN